LDAVHLSLPNPYDIYGATHVKCTLEAGKVSLKCKPRASTLQGKASTGGQLQVQVQNIISGFGSDLVNNQLCGGPGDATGSLQKKRKKKEKKRK